MEDIRTYLDTTGGQYHKGETSGVAIFCGVVFLGTGLFWLLLGGFFLFKYGAAFEEAAGGLALGAPGTMKCWMLSAFRLVMGGFLCYLGLLAWDMKRSFLYWCWLVVPAYVWFWGGYLLELDPDFRAEHILLENLFTYPALSAVIASLFLMVLALPAATLSGWSFRQSPTDATPVFVIAVCAVVGFGMYTSTSDLADEARTTPLVYCLAPLDDVASGLPVMKLVALGQSALQCHGQMDQLMDGLDRLQKMGRNIKFNAYDDRPGGERLVRLLQQSAGVAAGLECPDGGWYRIHKEDGHWRCSVHGDRLPPSERRVGGEDFEGDDGSLGGGESYDGME